MNNTPAHLWALAVRGILATVNGLDHALLGGVVPSPPWCRSVTATLRRDWEASNRVELLEQMTWLAREGHRKDFNDICALDLRMSARVGPQGWLEDIVHDPSLLKSIYLSRKHRERMGARSLLAWDMTRMGLIAGWGYLLQWISEGEAWSYVWPAAQAVQAAYGSWEELGLHHLIGREYWAHEWAERHTRAYRALLDDPTSPWRTLPWNTDLRQPHRMIPLQEIVVSPPPPPGQVARMRDPFELERAQQPVVPIVLVGAPRSEGSLPAGVSTAVSPRKPRAHPAQIARSMKNYPPRKGGALLLLMSLVLAGVVAWDLFVRHTMRMSAVVSAPAGIAIGLYATVVGRPIDPETGDVKEWVKTGYGVAGGLGLVVGIVLFVLLKS